jgi:hypothetical protein
MFWLENCSPYPRHIVKTFLTRTLPLLVCIAAGILLSWVSIYAFWFAVWTFHSVPVARAIDAVGSFLLWPARWVTEWVGGDQTSVFFDPVSFAGTNGLILGILFYCVFRAIWKRRAAVDHGQPAVRRLEAKVG